MARVVSKTKEFTSVSEGEGWDNARISAFSSPLAAVDGGDLSPKITWASGIGCWVDSAGEEYNNEGSMLSSWIVAEGDVMGASVIPAGEECTSVRSMFSLWISLGGGIGDEPSPNGPRGER